MSFARYSRRRASRHAEDEDQPDVFVSHRRLASAQIEVLPQHNVGVTVVTREQFRAVDWGAPSEANWDSAPHMALILINLRTALNLVATQDMADDRPWVKWSWHRLVHS